MHFYSISYNDLLNIPVYVFWELAKNIDRIRAEEDMRLFALMQNVVGGDPKELYRHLNKEKGQVVIGVDNTFDKEGLNRLRGLIARG